MNDGGPAFPIADQYTPNGDAVCQGCTGISVRDYFAAAAVQGLLQLAQPTDTDWNPTADAKAAYEIADAMLAERAK